MTEEAWFIWEKSISGIWGPAVVYGDRPKTRKHEEHMMTSPRKVPDECLTADGSPMFGRLIALYPKPSDQT